MILPPLAFPGLTLTGKAKSRPLLLGHRSTLVGSGLFANIRLGKTFLWDKHSILFIKLLKVKEERFIKKLFFLRH
jgi:hypothetical protein